MSTYAAKWKREDDAMSGDAARVKLIHQVSGDRIACLEFINQAPKLVTDDIIATNNQRWYKVTENAAATSLGTAVRCKAIPVTEP